MIILDATTKSLEIVLGGVITTSHLPYVLGYVDLLSVDQSIYSVGSNDGVTNNTTAVVVLAAPSTGHTRQVKFLSISNVDTASVIVTLQYNDNSTTRTIVKITLAVGDNLIYTD